MSGDIVKDMYGLFDSATGAPTGVLGSDGREYGIASFDRQTGQIADLSALAAVRGASMTKPVTASGNHRMLPSTTTASIGVAGSNVTGYRTIATQHPALMSFKGVWLRFANYDKTAGMVLNKCRVAPAAVSLTPTNDTLTFTAAASTTVGGSALPYTSALATAGNGTDIIPAVFSTDRIAVTNVARSDGGVFPLLRTLAYINDNAFPLNVSGANLVALNGASFNPGFVYGSLLNTSGTDFVTTPTTTSVLTNGGAFAPVEVIFDYDGLVMPLAVFGDSLDQGIGTVGSWAGWPVRLMFDKAQAALPVSASVYAMAGQKHADSMNTALAYIPSAAATNKPVISVSAWSPNDGAASQSVMDTCWANLWTVLRAAKAAGLRVMVRTNPPVNGYGAAEKARVLAQNTKVRNLAATGYVYLLDMARAIDPTDSGTILPAYEYTGDGGGLHYNDAGHAAIAAAAALALGV